MNLRIRLRTAKCASVNRDFITLRPSVGAINKRLVNLWKPFIFRRWMMRVLVNYRYNCTLRRLGSLSVGCPVRYVCAFRRMRCFFLVYSLYHDTHKFSWKCRPFRRHCAHLSACILLATIMLSNTHHLGQRHASCPRAQCTRNEA